MLTLCTAIKNNLHFILEWIAYLRLQGVERIAIADDESTDNPSLWLAFYQQVDPSFDLRVFPRLQSGFEYGGQARNLQRCVDTFRNLSEWILVSDTASSCTRRATAPSARRSRPFRPWRRATASSWTASMRNVTATGPAGGGGCSDTGSHGSPTAQSRTAATAGGRAGGWISCWHDVAADAARALSRQLSRRSDGGGGALRPTAGGSAHRNSTLSFRILLDCSRFRFFWYPVRLCFRPLSIQIFFDFPASRATCSSTAPSWRGTTSNPPLDPAAEAPPFRQAQDRNPGITRDAGPGKTLFHPAYIDKVCWPAARAGDAPRMVPRVTRRHTRLPRRGPEAAAAPAASHPGRLRRTSRRPLRHRSGSCRREALPAAASARRRITAAVGLLATPPQPLLGMPAPKDLHRRLPP